MRRSCDPHLPPDRSCSEGERYEHEEVRIHGEDSSCCGGYNPLLRRRNDTSIVVYLLPLQGFTRASRAAAGLVKFPLDQYIPTGTKHFHGVSSASPHAFLLQ